MAYLYREKFVIADLVEKAALSSKLILVAEAEDYLLALYAHYLKTHRFEVAHCKELKLLHECIKICRPDLLVLSTALAEHPSHLVGPLLKIRTEFNGLPIVTIGNGLANENLKQLMSAGVSGHLDRKLTRPKDMVHIVKAILEN